MRNLRNNSENPNGFNALDIIGERATAKDCKKAESLLEMNYGVEYPKEKFSMLWTMIQEEKWSSERLKRTVKWFLKNKKFPNWSIADWFEYEIRFYPYSWYLKKINEGIKSEDLQGYKIDGKVFWTLKTNEELPFNKI